MVVAVVLFGPDKIPEIARGLGSAVRKLKEASEDIKQEIMNPVEDVNPVKDIQKSIKDLNPIDDIKNSFQKVNPMDDFQKSFDEVRNPVNEIDEIVHEQPQTINTTPIVETVVPVEEVSAENIEKIVEQEQPKEEIKQQVEDAPKEHNNSVDEALGLGGSVSR